VFEGEQVTKGEVISDGRNRTTILPFAGCQPRWPVHVNEIQDVYRLQGVKITIKHIEVTIPPDAARKVEINRYR